MTFQELLKETSTTQFVDYFIEFDKVTEEHLEVARKALPVVTDKMKSKTVQPNGDVLLGWPVEDRDGPGYDVCLFLKDELDAWHADGMRCTLVEPFTFDSYKEAKAAFPKLPEHYAFEFNAWDEILGAQVFLPNVEKAGRLLFLATVFYEMTFFGLTEESHQAKTEEIRESLIKAEEELRNPETHNKGVSLDELLEKYGIERPKPTPDEEAERQRKACENTLRMLKERYAMLKEYVEAITA